MPSVAHRLHPDVEVTTPLCSWLAKGNNLFGERATVFQTFGKWNSGMAPYPVHLGTATVLGSAYGAAGLWLRGLDWGPVFLASGLTALGGVLPDLDSDSGVPIRELFGIAAAAVPALLYSRLANSGLTIEQSLVVLGALYLLIRYPLAALFKRWTVHRGIFHSVPAMFVAGLSVYLLFDGQSAARQALRLYLAGGIMLGFLSHLILDELYSVDFMGYRLRLNKYAGSALKLYSPSLFATLNCYALLAVLAFIALVA
jgi:hypothetical protein